MEFEMLEVAYAVQVAATVWMCAIIWLVQLVHYPSFHFIDAARFKEFERFHCVRITPVVMPGMLLEAASLAIYSLLLPAWRLPDIVSLLLLGIVWASTFFLQAPLHARLERGHDSVAIARLIRTNWLRTFPWSLRMALLIMFAPA